MSEGCCQHALPLPIRGLGAQPLGTPLTPKCCLSAGSPSAWMRDGLRLPPDVCVALDPLFPRSRACLGHTRGRGWAGLRVLAVFVAVEEMRGDAVQQQACPGLSSPCLGRTPVCHGEGIPLGCATGIHEVLEHDRRSKSARGPTSGWSM